MGRAERTRRIIDTTIDNRFKSGDIIQHFKRETLDNEAFTQNKYLYKIIGVATHSETSEPMMVYQPLYDEKGMYVKEMLQTKEIPTRSICKTIQICKVLIICTGDYRNRQSPVFLSEDWR